MDSLVQVLYSVSTVLLIPVIAVLMGFLAWALFEAGGFAGEWLERKRGAKAWRAFVAELQAPPDPPERVRVASFFDESAYPGLLAAFARRGKAVCRSSLHLNKLVSELEIEAKGALSKLSLGTRVGPMLGLMGTLIPMGPALIGLSTGNIEELAANLVVAFSTTVLGLLVGSLFYAMSIIRRRWYSDDLSDIEYIYQCLHWEGDPVHDTSQEHVRTRPVEAPAPS